ncbi:HepT-like ribonuclease domain-containing protein [uncultured Muribaculum sp.]|uniref:HepT-like ribonuclease domain-containing protein n=1 Tax=uncultured Muribaculum sp. TaxID=1918613 RepID=UPI0025B668C6|nr:HepT-like ribonuclease domain-containing protein [uncultured Muribaculum sp.]
MKHLQDVLDAINEMQSCFVDFPNRFDLFEQDLMRRCVVERKTEIMGEAINRIRKKDPTFEIPNAKEVINTHNRIIHGYDSVETEFLWGLVVRHIPELKKNIERIIAEYEEQYNRENNTESDCK